MTSRIFSRFLTASCIAMMVSFSPALAQDTKKPFEPEYGQQGKDVVWVPTAQALVDRMLDMARVTPQDYVIDLGSGDGRTVITAAKRGVKALGVEYNPDMVALSRRNAAAQGAALATFVQGDIFKFDFTQATVVTLFLLPDLNVRLRPILLGMKPGTRVVSNSFDMGDWEPDQEVAANTECTSYCRAMLWIVPAKVAGTWQMPRGDLTLAQTYQMVSGTLTSPGGATPISNARMRGDQISFTVGDKVYNGRVTGNRIEGTISDGGTWQATRR
jgi:SAM-dependent methyltransferase